MLPSGSEPPQPARVFRAIENGVSFPDGVQGTSGQAGDFTGLRGADPLDVLERIPSDWTAEPAQGEGGVVFRPPWDRQFTSIRIDPGDPNSRYPNSRGPYLRIFKDSYLDENGAKVDSRASEGHIPLKGNPGL
jgi:hypothetical protein